MLYVKVNKTAINELMTKKKLTYTTLAKAACMANSTVANIVKETKYSVDNTTVENMDKLAKALNVSRAKITEGKPFERYPKKETKSVKAVDPSKRTYNLTSRSVKKAVNKVLETTESKLPKADEPVKNEDKADLITLVKELHTKVDKLTDLVNNINKAKQTKRLNIRTIGK